MYHKERTNLKTFSIIGLVFCHHDWIVKKQGSKLKFGSQVLRGIMNSDYIPGYLQYITT